MLFPMMSRQNPGTCSGRSPSLSSSISTIIIMSWVTWYRLHCSAICLTVCDWVFRLVPQIFTSSSTSPGMGVRSIITAEGSLSDSESLRMFASLLSARVLMPDLANNGVICLWARMHLVTPTTDIPFPVHRSLIVFALCDILPVSIFNLGKYIRDTSLSLGELRPLPCLLETEFLSFLFPGIPGEKPFRL